MGGTFPSCVDWRIRTLTANVTSCPAISMTAGFTEAGLPVALQMVAPLRQEASLLCAAALFE